MKLVYFAWVRERLGHAEEDVSPPPEITTVGALLDWLRARDAAHADALADATRLRFAVNQVHAGLDAPLSAQDEVAIFPPVTGG